MKTLSRSEADALFDQYWDEMRQEFFKLEILQDYSTEDEGSSLRCWLGGDKQKSIKLMEEDVEDIQDYQLKVKQGVKLIRIHIVKKPYTPYIEWELEHYKHVNIPRFGEQVYLVDKSKISNLWLPAGDTMVFDKKRVVVNSYDSNLRMTHETFYDEHDNVDQFLELRETLIQLAKPL